MTSGVRWSELGPVTLTDEEVEECEQTIRSFTQCEDGEWVVKKEIVDWFRRGLIAFCLMGRAERFLSDAGGSQSHILFHTPYYSPEILLDKDLADKACTSAAKACAIYPLPIYFYDFACILYQIGKMEEAKHFFRQFLTSLESWRLAPTMEEWHKTRDVMSSARFAREMLN